MRKQLEEYYEKATLGYQKIEDPARESRLIIHRSDISKPTSLPGWTTNHSHLELKLDLEAT